jgi:putative flippase GtrA
MLIWMNMEEKRRFATFLIVGIISTLCNLSSRYLFELGMGYEWSLIFANAVGVLSAFVLNRLFVFKTGNRPITTELVRFTTVNLFGIALSWLSAVILYRWVFPAIGFTWHPDLWANAIGIAVPVLPNYFAHKAWTFNQSLRR